MAFRRGDQVEIASKETGFEDSYYTATVITPLFNNDYIVQYKNLLNEDLSGLLREIIAEDELRPAPPEIPVTGFRLGDKVDAFDNDGWWAGAICGENGENYLVYFEVSEEEVEYSMSELRVHHDWVKGNWVCSKI